MKPYYLLLLILLIPQPLSANSVNISDTSVQADWDTTILYITTTATLTDSSNEAQLSLRYHLIDPNVVTTCKFNFFGADWGVTTWGFWESGLEIKINIMDKIQQKKSTLTDDTRFDNKYWCLSIAFQFQTDKSTTIAYEGVLLKFYENPDFIAGTSVNAEDGAGFLSDLPLTNFYLFGLILPILIYRRRVRI